MSGKTTGKVWDLDLPHNQLIVLLAMADHADHNDGNIYPGVPLVAWKTGYSINQTRRIIQSLVKLGVLQEQSRPTGKAIRYRIDFNAGKQKAAYTPPKMVVQKVTDTPPIAMVALPKCDPSHLGGSTPTITSLKNDEEPLEPLNTLRADAPKKPMNGNGSVFHPISTGGDIADKVRAKNKNLSVAELKAAKKVYRESVKEHRKANPRKRPNRLKDWLWEDIEAYAADNPLIGMVSRYENGLINPTVKQLATKNVALHCIELYQEMQRNTLTIGQMDELHDRAEKRIDGNKYDIFQRMLWELPFWKDEQSKRAKQTLTESTPQSDREKLNEIRRINRSVFGLEPAS
jgi:hypothetical protein